MAEERTEASLPSCRDGRGEAASKRVQYVCSAMGKPYLNVIAATRSGVVHVLDRFHVMPKFGTTRDEFRAEEAKRLRRD